MMTANLAASAPVQAASRATLASTVSPSHYQIEFTPNLHALSFVGTVWISLDVKSATQSITLNSADLEIASAQLLGTGHGKITLNKETQTATFSFNKTIKPGQYTLRIAYKGKINKNSAGLFALDYTSGNAKQRALFTQFEASDARRFVPCFDEPAHKSTFELRASVPNNLMAVSNMPILEEHEQSEGYKSIVFQKTPKMSTYLLFFALGDFERISQKVNNVEIGVIVKRGETQKGQFALDAAAQMLPFFEDYFGVKYPLPKLDMIAAPGQSQTFGAMENWGAILYFDKRLLIDESLSTQKDKEHVYLVIAHEMAHQWFGNLVTMEWWDDLWLNEGFATWMEMVVTDHFNPQWNIWLLSQKEKLQAMSLDAKLGTHPVVQPIVDILQAGQAFDEITYLKGSSVIRMFENYVGADVFRKGVQSYMKQHAYKNTISKDLWDAIDAASAKKVSDIAGDFTLQSGIPLIKVQEQDGFWSLSQSRFSIDDSTPSYRSWRVPIDVKIPGMSSLWQGIVSRPDNTVLPVSSHLYALLDPNGGGYYRAEYSDSAFALLLKSFDELPASAQLNILSDTNELVFTGQVHAQRMFELFDKISVNLDPVVLAFMVEAMQRIDYLYTDMPDQTRFRAFARNKTKPIFDSLGWQIKAKDTANTISLRRTVLVALAQFDDAEIIKAAGDFFTQFLNEPKSLGPELRRSVLQITAKHGTESHWSQISTLATDATAFIEQQEYYRLLTLHQDSKLAQKCLALSQAESTPESIRLSLVAGVAAEHPVLAFDFVSQHSTWIFEHLEPWAHSRWVPDAFRNSMNPSILSSLKSYAKKHIPKTAMQSTNKALASIRFNIDIREKILPLFSQYLG